jgi:hypothetical protein
MRANHDLFGFARVTTRELLELLGWARIPVWGGISILKDHPATLRPVAKPEPLIRFETEPGRFIGYLRVSFYIPLASLRSDNRLDGTRVMNFAICGSECAWCGRVRSSISMCSATLIACRYRRR